MAARHSSPGSPLRRSVQRHHGTRRDSGNNRPIFFIPNFGEEPLHIYTEALLFSLSASRLDHPSCLCRLWRNLCRRRCYACACASFRSQTGFLSLPRIHRRHTVLVHQFLAHRHRDQRHAHAPHPQRRHARARLSQNDMALGHRRGLFHRCDRLHLSVLRASGFPPFFCGSFILSSCIVRSSTKIFQNGSSWVW